MMTQSCNQGRHRFLASITAVGTLAAVPVLARPVTDPLRELSAVQAVAAIRKSDKAEDYARALLDQCEGLKHLNTFITLVRDTVLEATHAVDQSRVRGAALGLLAGLPIPLKDSVCTATLPTTSGTRSLRNFQPAVDAVLWQRLSQSQVILI